ncbi:MAG TPA: ferric reductase-like transmembrane domain-containing protein [Marmoricola sp.]|jgi:predicted ferric reductase
MTIGTSDALWALGRGSGIAALVVLTLSLALGIIGRSGRDGLGLGRFGLGELHRTAALTGVGLVLVHLVSLLFDPYAQLRVVDLVFPFLGSYRSFWLGLGTVAVDLLLVVTGVSLLRQYVGPRVFRAVHWATYALWPVALVHAFGTGTDAATRWLEAIGLGCVAVVAVALTWRTSVTFGERGWRRLPRQVAR